MSCSAVVVA